MSQIVYMARSAAALTATLALAVPAVALGAGAAVTVVPQGLYGHLPSLSPTAPAGLGRAGAGAASGDGLPQTGTNVLPEVLFGAAILTAGAGLRAAAASKPG